MSDLVYIRTDRGLWRSGRCGYASDFADAGVYRRAEGEHLIEGLGPEKEAKLIPVGATLQGPHHE